MCGVPAVIVGRWTFPSTDGPVAQVQTRCLRGHAFTPTVESLRTSVVTAPAQREHAGVDTSAA
jgi:hypothetical protein